LRLNDEAEWFQLIYKNNDPPQRVSQLDRTRVFEAKTDTASRTSVG